MVVDLIGCSDAAISTALSGATLDSGEGTAMRTGGGWGCSVLQAMAITIKHAKIHQLSSRISLSGCR